MTAVYTLTFRGEDVVSCGRDPFLRLELAAGVIATLAAADEGATVALPAGSLFATSLAQRDEWAGQLAELSREHGVGLAFGIDLAADEQWVGARRPRSFAFACDRGRRLLWASAAARERPDALDDRAVWLGGRQTVVLLQSDIFRPSARVVVERAKPELTLVLAYGGATPRWAPAMTALDRLAPTLLVREELVRRKSAWSEAPRGWHASVLDASSFLTVHRFSPEAAAAQPNVATGD
jgi:hypothetical protein